MLGSLKSYVRVNIAILYTCPPQPQAVCLHIAEHPQWTRTFGFTFIIFYCLFMCLLSSFSLSFRNRVGTHLYLTSHAVVFVNSVSLPPKTLANLTLQPTNYVGPKIQFQFQSTHRSDSYSSQSSVSPVHSTSGLVQVLVITLRTSAILCSNPK